MRVSNSRTLVSAIRSTKNSLSQPKKLSTRSFTSTQNARVVVSPNTPNMRHAQRAPDTPGGLHVSPVNPANKYAAKADDMHRYGSWLMGCLPKYVQQFSVWKDELVIYISPSGVIPVFTFLKCEKLLPRALHFPLRASSHLPDLCICNIVNHTQITPLPNSLKYQT